MSAALAPSAAMCAVFFLLTPFIMYSMSNFQTVMNNPVGIVVSGFYNGLGMGVIVFLVAFPHLLLIGFPAFFLARYN